MRSLLILAASLALAGCQKAAAPGRVASSGAFAGSPAVKLDPADLDKYEAYEKSLVAALPQRLAEIQKSESKGANALAEGIDAELARLKKSSGLSPDAIAGWDELSAEVVGLRQNASQGLARMDAEAHARAAKLPPDQRARAEKQLEGVDEQLAKQRSLSDARAQFGDPAVDAAQKREPELAQLRSARLAVLAKLTAAGDPGGAR
jgi:hypothetical protein